MPYINHSDTCLGGWVMVGSDIRYQTDVHDHFAFGIGAIFYIPDVLGCDPLDPTNDGLPIHR